MQFEFSQNKIESINACRRYLQATTLADITNDRGNEIEEEAWKGTRVTTQGKYRYVMFNQQLPNPTAWGTWRSFLQRICRQKRQLQKPLGRWKVPAAIVRHPPMWVYDPQIDQLFKWSTMQQYYKCHRYSHKKFAYLNDDDPTHPATGFPTWVQETATGVHPMHHQ